MSKSELDPLIVNGWTIFAHPLFLGQLEALEKQVAGFKEKDSHGFAKKNATKRLAAIARLAFELIPQDPARPEYRQGDTLGVVIPDDWEQLLSEARTESGRLRQQRKQDG